MLSVQSGSMSPSIQKGDAVVVEPATNIRPGDIVSYRSPLDERITITHRVQAVDTARGLIVTKGDNLNIADKPFNDQLIVGRVRQRVAYAGLAIDALHSRIGLVVAAYIPATCVIVIELRKLTAYFRPTYRLNGYIQ